MSILTYLEDTWACILGNLTKLLFECIFPNPAFFLQLKEMDGSSFDELCETVENTLEMGLADSLVSKL